MAREKRESARQIALPDIGNLRKRPDGQWEIFDGETWVLVSSIEGADWLADALAGAEAADYDSGTGSLSIKKGGVWQTVVQGSGAAPTPPSGAGTGAQPPIDVFEMARVGRLIEPRGQQDGPIIQQDKNGQWWYWEADPYNSTAGRWKPYTPPKQTQPPLAEPEIRQDATGQWWYRAGSGDDWKPFTPPKAPQQQRPRDIDEQITQKLLSAKVLDESDPDFRDAVTLMRFKNQPSDIERFNLAMQIARSPADAITLAAIQYGDLPIQGTPGVFGRIGPTDRFLQQATDALIKPFNVGPPAGRVIDTTVVQPGGEEVLRAGAEAEPEIARIIRQMAQQDLQPLVLDQPPAGLPNTPVFPGPLGMGELNQSPRLQALPATLLSRRRRRDLIK